MSVVPIITFKAGKCDLDESNKPYKVKPDPTPGYIYLYEQEDLLHFCWRERSKPISDESNIDLIMFPGDGNFGPYSHHETSSKTNGRIAALKFSSSSQRHLFWLQSKPQTSDSSKFSDRDMKICQLVDKLLQGDEVDVPAEIARVQGPGSGDADGDEAMEDVEGQGGPSEHQGGSGGAGPDATGGDIREEGHGAREGGADGGRAHGSGPQDAASVVQNFLNSLKGGNSGLRQSQGQIYTTLPDLLPASTTIPTIDTATPAQIDNLLSYLPPTILLLAQESAASINGMVEPNAETASAAIQALSIGQKKTIIKRVLRSPQFHQSLGSLTMAIRDGGLPSISGALGLELANGGLVRGGNVPLGGGDAVEAFVEGVKKTVGKK